MLQGKKLILGAGQHWPKTEDNWRVDRIAGPNVDQVLDLEQGPWPWQDNTFLHINATHLIEHLRDLKHFMNEAHRVIMRGGSLYIVSPIAGRNAALEWSDPTHVRCYTPHSFINYMTIEGESIFKYGFKCWGNLHHDEVNDCMRVHCTPIK